MAIIDECIAITSDEMLQLGSGHRYFGAVYVTHGTENSKQAAWSTT
jgi:hypothetical protein